MARFLVTYHVGVMAQDPQSIAQARCAFAQWAAQAGAALADVGAPIRSVTTISSAGAHDGTPAGPFMGWSVIEAEDGNGPSACWVITRSSPVAAYCSSANRYDVQTSGPL